MPISVTKTGSHRRHVLDISKLSMLIKLLSSKRAREENRLP